MRTDIHEEIRNLIDRSLIGGISRDEEISMREHLNSCPQCRKYEADNQRVFTALDGFEFEATPGLNTQVHRSMQQRIQQMEVEEKERRRSMITSAAAFLMSFLGSFLLWGPVAGLASFLHIAADDLQLGLLLFWVVPSLLVALLIPVVSSLLNAQVQKGLTS